VGCLRCTLEGRGPDCEGTVAGRLFYKVWEYLGVSLTAGREIGISTDLAGNIVHGLAVLGGKCQHNFKVFKLQQNILGLSKCSWA
jgi:hypothetical protein